MKGLLEIPAALFVLKHFTEKVYMENGCKVASCIKLHDKCCHNYNAKSTASAS